MNEFISYLCTYDLYGPVRNAFDTGSKWASGRGLDPGNLEIFYPKWHSPIGSMPLHRAQKLSISRANTLPVALVMDMHAYKTLCTGLYKS